jgi:hypothetical protein
MPILILSRTRPSLRWERISVSHSIATAASPTAANACVALPNAMLVETNVLPADEVTPLVCFVVDKLAEL